MVNAVRSDLWRTLGVLLIAGVVGCGGDDAPAGPDDGVPSQLAFTVQAGDAPVGGAITPAPQVAIQDASGNLVASATNAVTVSLGANPGGGTLLGTTTVDAVGGVATFSDLSLDQVESGYTLVASSGSLTQATSAVFDILFRLASLSAGGVHTCGISAGGIGYCWGLNVVGQLGDGTTTDRLAPELVSGSLSFTSLGAGLTHTCGITAGGSASCWGANLSGQLGDGTQTQRPIPGLVSGGLSFASFSVGRDHNCGITTGGDAYCWGYNLRGQLGDGTTTDRLAPELVSGSLSFTSLSAGGLHTCGLTSGLPSWSPAASASPR